MPDVFISYASRDSQIAKWISKGCDNFGLTYFLAEVSLEPGSEWKDEILSNLRDSTVFLFLATENSIQSDACKHEIGAALSEELEIISVMWGVTAVQLPTWISNFQAVGIDGNDTTGIQRCLERIAGKKKKEQMGWLAVGAALLGLLWWGNRNP